jgi:predicted amidohydrolase YtcJ
VPDRPVRLQHRSLHLDVLNTAALQLTGLAETQSPLVERDPATGEPTGRLHHAAELLRGRLPRPTETELARDVRQACDRLLAWGITTVQDASVTNGVEEWELFHRLAHCGELPLRLFVMPGGRHWRDVLAARPPTARVRLGPVKLVLDEATTDPADLQATVAAVRRAGRAVALHAVSESEVAIALRAIQAAGPRRRSVSPDRLEHGATIAESWLPDLRAAGLMVVGQPSLVYQRGDAYLAEHPPELHGWLHRAGSLLAAGVGYAISSDAPLTEPAPGLGLYAARWRRTRAGALLGVGETLSPEQALADYSLAPARAAGLSRHLGHLRTGALADLAILDPDFLEAAAPHTGPARLTVTRGQIVWRRSNADASGHEAAGRGHGSSSLE